MDRILQDGEQKRPGQGVLRYDWCAATCAVPTVWGAAAQDIPTRHLEHDLYFGVI